MHTSVDWVKATHVVETVFWEIGFKTEASENPQVPFRGKHKSFSTFSHTDYGRNYNSHSEKDHSERESVMKKTNNENLYSWNTR